MGSVLKHLQALIAHPTTMLIPDIKASNVLFRKILPLLQFEPRLSSELHQKIMSNLLRYIQDYISTYFTTKYQALKYAPHILQAIRDATSCPLLSQKMYLKPVQDRKSLLAVTTTQSTLHKRNCLLIPLPLSLASMLFPAPRKLDISQPLLLASCLTTVLVIRPTQFVIPMAVFIPPQPGSCLNPPRTNYKPNTIILSNNIVLLMLPPSLPHFQILDQEVILPVKIHQACYLHSQLGIHWRSYHQKKPPQFQILDQ